MMIALDTAAILVLFGLAGCLFTIALMVTLDVISCWRKDKKEVERSSRDATDTRLLPFNPGMVERVWQRGPVDTDE